MNKFGKGKIDIDIFIRGGGYRLKCIFALSLP